MGRPTEYKNNDFGDVLGGERCESFVNLFGTCGIPFKAYLAKFSFDQARMYGTHFYAFTVKVDTHPMI